MAKSVNIKEYIESVAYTKTQTDTKLAEKSATDHTHDDRYYTETEIDSAINTVNGTITSNYNTLDGKIDGITNSNGTGTLDVAIDGKADSTHNHDGTYAPASHTHGKADITDFAHGHSTGDILLSDNTTSLTSKLSSIDSAISSLQSADWDIEIVTSLPQSGTAGRLYFLHDANEAVSGDGNAFDEYVWDATNSRFEKLGQRKINLTNYVTDVDIELSSSGILTVSLTKDSNATPL